MKKRKSKYNARKVEMFGLKFDSKLESQRYIYLRSLVDAGDIRKLRVHPWYELAPSFTDRDGKRWRAINYEADFEYLTNGGQMVVEDAKGVETAVYRIKRKLFLRQYPDIVFRQVKTATAPAYGGEG